MTYDPTTDAGKVRLLIMDVDVNNETFSDAEIAAFLAMEGDDVRLAAAQALDTIAINEALVLKVIRNMNLSTDGAKLATTLMERAEKLRDRVDESGDLDYAETIWNDWVDRDYVRNDLVRNQ